MENRNEDGLVRLSVITQTMGLILGCTEYTLSLSQLLQLVLELAGMEEDALPTKRGHSSGLSKIFQFKLSPPQLIIWVLIKKYETEGKAQPSSKRRGEGIHVGTAQMGQLWFFCKNHAKKCLRSCVRVMPLQPALEAINSHGICSLRQLTHTELPLKPLERGHT